MTKPHLRVWRNFSAGILAFALATGICRAEIPVVNGEYWPDTNGKHINCHGGGIILGPDSTYYWYGEHRGFDAPQEGVACYTSRDLTTWSDRGIVMRVSDEPGAIIERGSTIERPKVIYNPATRLYVMWFHHELKGRGYEAAHAAVAVADNPLGPFKPLRSARVNPGILPANIGNAPAPTKDDLAMEWWTPRWYKKIEDGMFVYRDLYGGQMSRDMTIFIDDDGTAYHIYSSEDNLTLHIAELDPTYTAHTGRYIRIFPGGHNEAPALFKKDGRYWMITSGCTGWAPNAARLMWADSIMGEWHMLPNPCRGEGADTTFGGQSTFILRVGNSITLMADIWNPKSLPDSRHLWLPVSFDENGTPFISAGAATTLPPYRFESHGNPVIRHKHTADPAALVKGDTLWLFTGHDEPGNQPGYHMNDWLVFSTTDLCHWTEHHSPLKVTDFCWAPAGNAFAGHVTERNGRYYWYVSTNWKGIGVAVADNITGPYKDALGKPLLTNDDCFASTHSWACIDPAVFIDDDGSPYIIWGNRECYMARLKDNMTEIDGEIKQIHLDGDLPFTEAPWLWKHKGRYYLAYAAGWPEKIAYAISDKVEGPYKPQGVISEIAGNCNTTHPAIVKFGNRWIFISHNGGLDGGGSGSRSVVMEPMEYNTDGTIRKIHPSSEGVPPTCGK